MYFQKIQNTYKLIKNNNFYVMNVLDTEGGNPLAYSMTESSYKYVPRNNLF